MKRWLLLGTVVALVIWGTFLFIEYNLMVKAVNETKQLNAETKAFDEARKMLVRETSQKGAAQVEQLMEGKRVRSPDGKMIDTYKDGMWHSELRDNQTGDPYTSNQRFKNSFDEAMLKNKIRDQKIERIIKCPPLFW